MVVRATKNPSPNAFLQSLLPSLSSLLLHGLCPHKPPEHAARWVNREKKDEERYVECATERKQENIAMLTYILPTRHFSSTDVAPSLRSLAVIFNHIIWLNTWQPNSEILCISHERCPSGGLVCICLGAIVRGSVGGFSVISALKATSDSFSLQVSVIVWMHTPVNNLNAVGWFYSSLQILNLMMQASETNTYFRLHMFNLSPVKLQPGPLVLCLEKRVLYLNTSLLRVSSLRMINFIHF